MERFEYYELKEPIDIDSLRKLISRGYTAVQEQSVKEKQSYLDTFDFRLYNRGYFLYTNAESYILHNSHIEKPIASLPRKRGKKHKFWWDMPDCALKEELESSIDVRALLPLIDIEKVATPVSILNEDEKTVIRLSIEEIKTAGGGASINHVCLMPVRGYVKERNDFIRLLSTLNTEKTEGNYIKAALESVGKDPKDFSSKLSISLKPDMPSSEALRIILKSLHRVIELNEPGIADDIDIEFLHDYRVAVRRTRSALGQIKGVYPDSVTKGYREKFAKLGAITNLLRDLDIYLLHKARYRAMLPSELNPGLDHMFSIFGTRRKKAHKELVKALKSKAYKEAMKSWGRFLSGPLDNNTAPNAQVPVIDLSAKIILKKYKQIIKKGGKIDSGSPDADLHRLRIECKKLRYMLEFFSSLYPEEDIRILVKHLKKLQDNLGDFNDLSVQQVSLKEFAGGLDQKNDEDRETIVSSGGLISLLFQRQKEIRSQFSEKFREFSDEETSDMFHKLFKKHKDPEL